MTGRGGGGGRRVLVPPITSSSSFSNQWWFNAARALGLFCSESTGPGLNDCNGYRSSSLARYTGDASPNSAERLYHIMLLRSIRREWTHATVSVWLYEQLSIRIEGKIRGFDEFMNLVIDDAVEVKQITKTNDKESRRPLGQILLKGDNVSLIQSAAS
ncbi:unnamed protein product [Fusarium venenatum]|uniref:Small nuclear ribonucleoprotein E n=1 Tax=Fusarium venenatum TaxID=56646 RepID=A0A2L2T9Z3_9HYPO|nr:uncharacterized protein FVRRES_03201 [Fusarium venenatum]CEI66689.1 unnamed protein product [Fusarium venenatum]